MVKEDGSVALFCLQIKSWGGCGEGAGVGKDWCGEGLVWGVVMMMECKEVRG